MPVTDSAFPCPVCEYDLRGHATEKCPECGTPFSAKDLTPEVPGLAAEHWLVTADTAWRRGVLPLRIAFSPVKAFHRQCRLNQILFNSPLQILTWTLLWIALLVFFGICLRYGLDQLLQRRLAFGTYWNDPRAPRTVGSIAFLPVSIPLAWIQCLVLSCAGMAISLRPLSITQLVRLATFLFPTTLLAGLFATVFDPVWHSLPSPQLFRWPELGFPLLEMESWFVDRSFEVALGLVGGLAVGTVLQRRRMLIAIVSAIILASAVPLLVTIQIGFRDFMYFPVERLVLGPRPLPPPPRASLLLGPTFTTGTCNPLLAGEWNIYYDNADNPETRLTLDSKGCLIIVEDKKGLFTFAADGVEHSTSLPAQSSKVTHVRYKVLSGVESNQDKIMLHVRMELNYSRKVRNDYFEDLPAVIEETMTGDFSVDGRDVAGESVLIRDAPGLEPSELRRPFVMRVVQDTSN